MLEGAGGYLEVPGALGSSLSFSLCLSCCSGCLPSSRIWPVFHVLQTMCLSIGFLQWSTIHLCSSRSSACPRRHDGSAHGGTWAALSLPRGGGKQRLPFLKQIINERLGWSSNFWAAEGVYSRKMHTHVRLKGPENFLGFCNWTKQVSTPYSAGLTKKPEQD